MHGGVTFMRTARKVLVPFARLAGFSVAILLVAGSVLGTRLPSAHASGLTSVADYYLTTQNGDSWGTAFDSSGRVWTALPGCDPSPSCGSSTPPGKLVLFDPAAHRWVTVVSLPAGYGQPLFVKVDSAGKVWFTMPVTNSIGAYDPVRKTTTQWAVPTASVGPWDLAIDSTRRIWFTEHYVNQTGSFDPAPQPLHEEATPPTTSH